MNNYIIIDGIPRICGLYNNSLNENIDIIKSDVDYLERHEIKGTSKWRNIDVPPFYISLNYMINCMIQKYLRPMSVIFFISEDMFMQVKDSMYASKFQPVDNLWVFCNTFHCFPVKEFNNKNIAVGIPYEKALGDQLSEITIGNSTIYWFKPIGTNPSLIEFKSN